MLPDREMDDLLSEMVQRHQHIEERISNLEKIELPQNVHANVHLQLPQLRGYWPMSSVDEIGDPYDLSGQGRVLNNNNAVPFGVYNLLPYADLTPGSTHYFSRPDEAGLDITGALTLGCWCWLDTIAPANNMTLLSKYTTTGNQRAFILYYDIGTSRFRFIISTDGINNVVVTSTVVPAVNTWYKVVGRFTPSNLLSIYVDDVVTNNAVGIPATIFNSSANFLAGSYNAGLFLLDGRLSQLCLAADDHDDAVILSSFERTRANFDT